MKTQLPLIVAGKFRLTRRVGDGAMGVVYRGMDVQLSRPVAIKTLPRLNMPAAARLRREARVIASVSHPNLASIYGVESWRGMPMLVLELLSGGTLADRLHVGPMPSAEALQVGVSLAEALGAVHRAGILHRDVKPSNIGFTADGVPKLLDFGVSRLLDRAADGRPVDSADRREVRAAIASTDDDLRLSTTADGRVVGTLLYLSPEALNAERPTETFDLWSLCIVLFEAIAGRHPLRAATIAELVTRITRCDVPDIRSFLPGADPSLAKFFQDAFSPRREDRPRSAADLRDQLQSLLAG
jgi:serine/threonine protein kinase